MPYSLVPDNVSHDTVTALEQLLEKAKSGEVIGILFGVLMKRRRYAVNIAGEARRDTALSRGICAALDDELSALVHEASGPMTNF